MSFDSSVALNQLVALALLTTTACAPRYEYVSPTCADVPTPRPTSAVAWQTTTAAHTITGRVLNVSDASPIEGAQVRLRPDGRLRFTNRQGFVRFDSVAVGVESLFVIALQHSLASAALTIVDDSGVVFLGSLNALPLMMSDGCGSVLERRQKPWWKVW